MKQKVFLWLLGLALLLSGCHGASSTDATDPSCRVVTGISVTYENGPLRARRLYTSNEKMRRILNYLRLIDPYGRPAEDPDTVEGSLIRIVLSHSDGCEKVYEQKADRFMMIDGGGWKRIDPVEARELGMILGEMESDGQ